jgi:cation transporter-like permease
VEYYPFDLPGAISKSRVIGSILSKDDIQLGMMPGLPVSYPVLLSSGTAALISGRKSLRLVNIEHMSSDRSEDE